MVILKNKDISMAKIAAINLHPGSPKYRGIGCLNYALYNNEKKFGFTIHLISRKIDYGKILFVRYFSINKNNTVVTLLQKTHEQCIKYSKVFFAKRPNCENLINKELNKKGLNLMRPWRVTLKEYIENSYSTYL